MQHNFTGNLNVSEAVVQRALFIELFLEKIVHSCEVTMSIKYKGIHAGYVRVDFVVYDKKNKYVIEIKRD